MCPVRSLLPVVGLNQPFKPNNTKENQYQQENGHSVFFFWRELRIFSIVPFFPQMNVRYKGDITEEGANKLSRDTRNSYSDVIKPNTGFQR